MYEDFQTRISFEYIEKLKKELKRPLVILGGWAVYFLVNKNFYNLEGRNYLGSKDLDIGYYLEENMTVEELLNSSLSYDISKLKEMGFNVLGFRFMKQFHSETKDVLDMQKAKNIPQHNIVNVYIDPIVNMIPAKFKETFRFTPIDEPYLTKVFEKDKIEYDNDIIIPNPEVLLCMKLNSALTRDEIHKKQKDISDIFALLAYSDIDIEKFLKLYDKDKAMNTLAQLNIKDASELLNVKERTIRNVFDGVVKR